MTDTIADLINRINNAKAIDLEKIDVPYSGIKENILKVLKAEGYISNYFANKADCGITINLDESAKSFKNIVRYSKPGKRIYVSSKRIPRPKSGYGMVVISTPLGVLSGDKARKSGVGGEVICEVW